MVVLKEIIRGCINFLRILIIIIRRRKVIVVRSVVVFFILRRNVRSGRIIKLNVRIKKIKVMYLLI